MNLIDCKPIRSAILSEVKTEVEQIFADTGNKLKLVVIQVGNDPASNTYIKNKIKTADEVGIKCEHIKLPETVGYDTVERTIIKYALDNDCHGIMMQLPIPDQLKKHQQDLLNNIPWFKDVDGLSTTSVGRLWNNQPCLVPCTAQGIMNILPEDLSRKTVCIINRSPLIGKPLAKLILDRNGTPIICHSKTEDIYFKMAYSGYVVTAMGKPKEIDYDADLNCLTIIDAAICRDELGKLCGDVNIETFEGSECNITPVPGGVGLLTTAQLMANVVKAYKLQSGLI